MEEPFVGLERIDVGDFDSIPLPAQVLALIEDADARIERFARDRERIPAFAACNAHLAYKVLSRVLGAGLASGSCFCEWGSGFGVVACLAARLGLQASGIEIEPALIAESRSLARDHGAAVRYLQGSYLAHGVSREARRGQRERFSPGDFDIIYAYPWPAEQHGMGAHFRAFARPGALLILYHGGGRFAVFRKPAGRI